MKILDSIRQAAAKLGCNSVSYIGMRRGAQAFSVGYVGDDGMPLPTGMPTIILKKGAELTVVDGIEALDLL